MKTGSGIQLYPTAFEALTEMLPIAEAAGYQASDLALINVDNVARWVYDHHLTREPNQDLLKAFPIVVPPWPLSWTEYQMTPEMRVGVFLYHHRPEDVLGPVDGVVTGRLFYSVAGRSFPVSMIQFVLTEEGQVHDGVVMVLDDDEPDIVVDRLNFLRNTAEYGSEEGAAALTLLVPVLASFAFAHCHNVEAVEREQRPPTVKRKPGKLGPPKITYKTLVIDGMARILEREGGIRENGAKKAFHICRGHFVRYTADKPLFGRVTGTFWKRQHTRGSKERGEVIKDYAVSPAEKRRSA